MADTAKSDEFFRPTPSTDVNNEAVPEATDQTKHPADAFTADGSGLGPRTRNPEAAPEHTSPSILEVQVLHNFNGLKRRGSLDVLDTLFRASILHQRAALDKHYLSLDYHEYDDDNAAWTSLATGLDQFSRAMETYKKFVTDERNLLVTDRPEFLQAGARMAAIERYEAVCQGSPDKEGDLRPMINEGIQKLHDLPPFNLKDPLVRPPPEESEDAKDEKPEEEEMEERDETPFWTRFRMAVAGGAPLVMPMVAMTLYPSRTTALTTTAVFVPAVAALLASSTETVDQKDVMRAAAAYAAVLVVFIGASSVSSSGTPWGSTSSHLEGSDTAGIAIGLAALLLVFLLAGSRSVWDAIISTTGRDQPREPEAEIVVPQRRGWFEAGRRGRTDRVQDATTDDDSYRTDSEEQESERDQKSRSPSPDPRSTAGTTKG